MNDLERAIWAAAYGAAFVVVFERTRRSAERIPAHQRHDELPSDVAIRVTRAEEPGYIADLAVQRYRDWQREENPTFGLLVE